jgi:hypothetical protein
MSHESFMAEPENFDELMAKTARMTDVERGEEASKFYWRVEAPRWRSQGYTEEKIGKLWVLFMRKAHGID